MTTKLFTALFAAVLVFSPVPDTYIPADDDVTALAQMAYGEARGLADYEIAACMWVALNRLDHGGYGLSLIHILKRLCLTWTKVPFPTWKSFRNGFRNGSAAARHMLSASVLSEKRRSKQTI